MSAEDFVTRTGLAQTAHAALLPVDEAMRLTGGEYQPVDVVIDSAE